ncbi:4985_t:CDS:2 [Ambispora gerdemannii]|uniref:4985_t:CDS:1 n=1 Tax=Ambispora gerdemannii TaxID=144530 RepID=A0A9N8YQ91_9GLOM|nr:4985_t:CDS:2 [Ambispora gerdemannii]
MTILILASSRFKPLPFPPHPNYPYIVRNETVSQQLQSDHKMSDAGEPALVLNDEELDHLTPQERRRYNAMPSYTAKLGGYAY